MRKKPLTQKPTIENQPHYSKIGRLRKPIADQIRRKSADIYIDENHLKHVFNKHKAELTEVGLTPKMFVDLVVNNFNRIYKGHNTALMLVLWNGKPKVTVIEMNLVLKKGFYEIKTATVMSKDFFNKREILWKKE